MELPSLEAVKRFVAMGNGVALVPGLTVGRELASGELVRVPVEALRFERHLRLVHRKQANLSHAALAFLRWYVRYRWSAACLMSFASNGRVDVRSRAGRRYNCGSRSRISVARRREVQERMKKTLLLFLLLPFLAWRVRPRKAVKT